MSNKTKKPKGSKIKMAKIDKIKIFCFFAVFMMMTLNINVITNNSSASSDGKGSWTTKLPMSTARAFLGVVECNGKVYAIGGYKPGSGFLNTVETYNPSTNSWEQKSKMPIEVALFGIVTVGDCIYVIGGCNEFYGCYTWQPAPNNELNILLVYNTTSDCWDYKTPMPTARYGLTTTAVNGKIYAIGGAKHVPNGCVPPAEPLDVVEVYDTDADSWETLPPMPTPRYFLGSAAIMNKIYVIGGSYRTFPDEYGNCKKVEVFDTMSQTWDNVASLSYPRSLMGTVTIDNEIYIIGGTYENYENNNNNLVVTNKVERYSVAANTWEEMTGLPTARYGLDVCLVNNKVYAIGGKSKHDGYFIGGTFYTKNEEFTPPLPNQPPTVTITYPYNGTTVSGMVSIQGTSNDVDGTVQSVQIKIDSGSWTTVTGTTSWSYSWDTTVVSAGSHIIYARSYDGKKYSNVSSVTVTVNIPPNQPPTVVITYPYNDQEVKGTITIRGTASDSDGSVQKVEVRIDSGSWYTASGTTSWHYVWNTESVNDGSHIIYARSYDGKDYSSYDLINTNVKNKKNGDIPSFELTAFVVVLVAVLWLRKRRK